MDERGPEHRVDHTDLHVFTNCDRVILTVDGNSLATLERTAYSVLGLDGPFSVVEAEGFIREISVHEKLSAWNEPATIALDIDTDPFVGRVLTVDVSIRDASGALVRDWNGNPEYILTVLRDISLMKWTQLFYNQLLAMRELMNACEFYHASARWLDGLLSYYDGEHVEGNVMDQIEDRMKGV